MTAFNNHDALTIAAELRRITAGDWQRCSELLRFCLRHRDQPLARATGAAVAFAKGDHILALDLMVTDDPSYDRFNARVYERNGRLLDAWHCLKRATEDAPDDRELMEERAALEFRMPPAGINVPEPCGILPKRPTLAEIAVDLAGVPLWRGTRVRRLLLIASSSGQGDQIMAARILPIARRRCEHLTVAVPPSLWRLFERIDGADMMVPWDPINEALANSDAQAPLFIAALGLWNLTKGAPYIRPAPKSGVPGTAWPAANRATPHRRFGRPLQVGLVWAGSSSTTTDHYRSTTLAALAPLGRVSGVTFHNLQIPQWKNADTRPLGLEDMVGHDPKDFADTADIIAKLDLVITVDTAVAHLAGALGCPVWIAIANPQDPRWGRAQATRIYDSAWLVRQPRHGDWDAVFSRMARALSAAAKAEH